MIEPNYTTEQTRELVTRYQSGETVEQIAEVLGKSVRSVVAKLSREGVYKPTTKNSVRTTKAMVIEGLAIELGIGAETIAGLEKCDKITLDALFQAVVK